MCLSLLHTRVAKGIVAVQAKNRDERYVRGSVEPLPHARACHVILASKHTQGFTMNTPVSSDHRSGSQELLTGEFPAPQSTTVPTAGV